MTRERPGTARNVRNIRQRGWYCRRCGSPWRDEWVVCEGCGADVSSRVLGYSRPTVEARGDEIQFVGPWKMLAWPGQGTVALHGGPGSGKSSLSAMLLDDDNGRLPKNRGVWITKEQDPKPVGKMMRRIVPSRTLPPIIARVEKPNDVAERLQLTDQGPVIVDSLTAFGLKEALIVAHLVDAWAKRNNERALCIIQVTKDGSAAGYMEIKHLFDAIVALGSDKWGRRQFRVEKNRWGPEGALYWKFDDRGEIVQPSFNASYSVEGIPGSFYLHPYPLPGAKWCGLLDLLDSESRLIPGLASAAYHAAYMPTGFIRAPQEEERKRFAVANGLRWVDPENLHELLDGLPARDEEDPSSKKKGRKQRSTQVGREKRQLRRSVTKRIEGRSYQPPHDEQPITDEE